MAADADLRMAAWLALPERLMSFEELDERRKSSTPAETAIGGGASTGWSITTIAATHEKEAVASLQNCELE